MPVKPALVISDVDGTLVRKDKSLSDANRLAVLRLGEAKVGFSLVSSRPPFGMRMFIEPLQLTLPMAAYNGGTIFMPDGRVLSASLIAPDVAAMAIEILRKAEVDIWVFGGDQWIITNEDGSYVSRERRTIQTEPTIVPGFDNRLGSVSKIVASSGDFERLAATVPVLNDSLGGQAVAARSQLYYIDITPSGTNKGTAVAAIAAHLRISTSDVMSLGDMENDLPMFNASGFSVAMGNATPEVKARASAVTTSNEDDGVTAALHQFVLDQHQVSSL